jgi:DNA-binding GntR family transcriptional regulator
MAGDDVRSENGTLHAEVLMRLRTYIVEGEIAAGARIPERELCKAFDISRTPLREALKVLAAEGLVDLQANRGAWVKILTGRELQDLFDVMGGIEALAGRLACECISDFEIVEIESLHYEMYGHYMSRNLHEYFRCNQEIHLAIVRATHNEALIGLHGGYTARLRRARFAANQANSFDRWGQAMREHEQILDCLKRRDADALGSILFSHLRNKSIASSSVS